MLKGVPQSAKGAQGDPRGTQGESLGEFWGTLGGPLGKSREGLGDSWGSLLGLLGHREINDNPHVLQCFRNLRDPWGNLGGPLGIPGGARGGPVGVKEGLGSPWGGSWGALGSPCGDLGEPLGSILGVFFHARNYLISGMKTLGHFGGHLGSLLAPLGFLCRLFAIQGSFCGASGFHFGRFFSCP